MNSAMTGGEAIRGPRVPGRLAFWLFLYIPLSMPGTMAIAYLTGLTWSWATVFLRPETVLALALLGVCFGRRGARQRLWALLRGNGGLRATVGFGVAFVTWYALAAIVQGAFPGYWLRNLLVGWIIPALVALALRSVDDENALRLAWKGLIVGLAILTVECLVLYIVSFGIPTSFHEIVFVNRTSRVHAGVRGGVYFGRVTLGEFNALAVFFTGVVAGLSGALCRVRADAGTTRRMLVAGLVAALGVEYLCYSRGAVIAIGIVAALIGAMALLWPVNRTRGLFIALGINLLFLGSLFIGSGSWDYWMRHVSFSRGSTSAIRLTLWKAAVDGRSEATELRKGIPEASKIQMDQALVSALQSREGAPRGVPLAQDPHRAEDLRREISERVKPLWRRAAFGYGPGNFGVHQGLVFETSTHNLCFDAFADAGAIGCVLFIGLWCTLGIRLLRAARREGPEDTRRGAGPSATALFLALLAVFISGNLVSFQLVSAGAGISGAILWLVAVTPEPSVRH